MTPERRRLALRASSMALRIRQQYGIALDQPCCVYDLAEKMGVEVRFAELPSAEGVYSPGKPVAIVSSLRPPGRQAFTCAHELGHHAYGHGEQFDELIEDRGKRRRYDPKEFEADCFASALLMPKTALLKGLALRRWSPKNISAAQMYALASWLGVGYATLIGNMQWGMNLLERNQAAALEKLKGPQIRESIIGCKCKEPSETTVIDSDVWPDQIDLLIEDQAGQTHHLTRARGGAVENADDPIEGPVTFPVECYGQGETQQISQRAQTDPSALLDYLDRFVDIEAETAREGELRQTLLELQSKIEEAIRKVEIIPQYERDLALAQSQIQALEKAKAKEIIVLQRKVELERQARQVITTSVQAIARGTAQEDLKKNLATLKTAADPKTLVVGSDEFASIYAQAGVFENALTSVETTVKGAATTLSTVVTEQLTAWRAKEQSILKRIDDKKRELEAQGIRVDMAYIQKLATDEARLKQDVTNLKKWKPHLEDLWKQRKEALKERWSVRARIAMKRSAFGQKASAALRASLADLNVALKFDENGYSPEANGIIVETMGWRTLQVPRANALTEKLTLPKLLDAIGRKDPSSLQALTTDEGVNIFSKSDALGVIEKLSPDPVRFRLERAEIFDRPRLTVTKLVTDSGGKKHPRTREFRQLSLGQQQSVLLAIMLSADSNTPLIIDQPEDNLDGEFIYQSVIPVAAS